MVAALAEGAARRGHDVSVVCATGSSWAGKWCTGSPETSDNGVKIFRLRTFSVLSSQPVAPGYPKAAKRSADVVYTHRPHPLADLALFFERRRPVIVFHLSDVQRKRVVGALIRPLARRIARRAAATVMATESHRKQSSDLGVAGLSMARVIQ